jgi:hypothetical protein
MPDNAIPDWLGYTLAGIVAVGAGGMVILSLTHAVRKWWQRRKR